MKKYLIILALLIFASSQAQTPQTINYQGILRNHNGYIIPNRDISVKIEIKTVTSFYSFLVYSETHQATTNEHGLFTLKIGSGTVTSGTFKKIAWGYSNHKVLVYVDENNGTNYQLIGSSEFSSVPYSLMSKSTGILQSDMQTVAVSKKQIEFPLNTSAEQSTFNVFSDDGKYDPNKQELDGIAIINEDKKTRGDVSLKLSSRSEETYDGVNHNQCTVVLNSVATGKDKADFTIQNEFVGSNRVKETFRIRYNGNVGIDNQQPEAKLQISHGDVYIDDTQRGIIMRSSNGHCWRYRPDNNGRLHGQRITCP